MSALFVMIAAVSATPAVLPARAEQFLLAFAKEPSASKSWFTKDAVVIFGDIGLSVSEALPVINKSSAAWMATCRVAHVEQKPIPSSLELKDAPAWLKNGELSAFSGEYACVRENTRDVKVKFDLVFKDDRVAMLAFGEGPPHG